MQLLVDNLTCHRGGRAILSGLSLRVSTGEGLLLTGPNGAGKTTLLRTIAGYIRPVTGTIELEGGAEDTPVGEQCQFIGHQNAVKPALTVRENVGFWAAFLGSPVGPASLEKTIGTALDRFDLAHLADVPAGYLSAGQKRRLALARLLVADRPLWLLDEPTVSLDARSVAIFAAVVDEHVKAGGMVVAATHVPLGIAAVRELRLEPRREAA